MVISRRAFSARTTNIRILFVAASPSGSQVLNIGSEQNAINEAISTGRHAKNISLDMDPAVNSRTLRRALSQRRYDVLHISAHASDAGVLFHHPEGGGELFPMDKLSGLLAMHALSDDGGIRCVLLNACDSSSLGELSALSIPYTITMSGLVADEASIEFSRGFYDALALGWTVERAYKEGRAAARIVDEAFESRLLAGPGVEHRHGLVAASASAYSWVVSEEPQAPSPTPHTQASGPKLLHCLQREIFAYFDEIGLERPAQLAQLGEVERRVISRKLLPKLAGLGYPASELLDLGHLNLKFRANQLSTLGNTLSSAIDVLNRKTAIYSEHALVCLEGLKLPSRDFDKRKILFDDATLSLLLEHKELIEQGRMSVVPDVVLDLEGESHCIFRAEETHAVDADLSDPEIYRFMIERGELLPSRQPALMSRIGVLKLNTPSSEGVPLERIFEIEEEYSDAFLHFQRYLHDSLRTMNEGSTTENLKRVLQEVDDAMRELDDRYAARRRRPAFVNESLLRQGMAAGALAVGLYAANAELAGFIGAAVAGAGVSNLITYFPPAAKLPPEVRDSPYFIPWKIRRESRGH